MPAVGGGPRVITQQPKFVLSQPAAIDLVAGKPRHALHDVIAGPGGMFENDQGASLRYAASHGDQEFARVQGRGHARPLDRGAERAFQSPPGGYSQRGNGKNRYSDTVVALPAHQQPKPWEGGTMLAKLLTDLLTPSRVVHAHCDLPCGVYDPAQARIEADSVMAIQKKYQDAEGQKKPSETVEDYKARCLVIKEERADLVKHHLWVLWTDYFKPEHKEKYANLHDLFWQATKEAGESKKSTDPKQGQKLLDLIGEIDRIFWETKGGKPQAA
jgi:nickel superoxide dismutase